MAHMVHPKTGKDVRTEYVCENNGPGYEHDFETIKESWAEFVIRCKVCGFEDGGGIG